MSRDKSDTLLLLTACALVLAPQTSFLPLWISLLCSTVLAWRGWVTFSGNRMPSRWLLLPLATMAMVGIFWSYRTLLGREAGVAMLVLLIAFKLLEMHAKRDLFVVVFLSFFLILTNFFNSQSIGTALMMIAALIALLTTLLSFQYTGVVPPFRQRLGSALFIFGLAVPLTFVLFMLFPRIQGPLWGLPSDANTGRTGLSESMAPGNISKLAQSNDIAFRVKFIDPAPARSNLYWRADVLGNFDGRTWTRSRPTVPHQQVPIKVPHNTSILRHQVTLEPNGRRWLFALEMPGAAPVINGNSASITSDMQILAKNPINDRVRYEVASFLDYQLQADAIPASLQRWLILPSGYNPNTLRFAAQIRSQTDDQQKMVEAVLTHFRKEPFSYTLEPPRLGRHSVDEFLFVTRAGFCEHYASAFVVLMRALGIPARVVTGYQGGEINSIDGFMTVRQSDAHAWTEVWLENRGWLRIDPTAAVAPNRIERNLESVIPRRGLDGLFSFAVGRTSWIAKLRLNWDAATNSWNQWVLNYTPERQKRFLESLGFDNVNWQTMIALLLTIGTLVMAFIAWPLIINRQKIAPIKAVYLAFCRHMERQGYVRAPHEGPREYGKRLAEASLPPITADKKMAIARFLSFYEAAQYGTVGTASTTVSTLKSLLAKCR